MVDCQALPCSDAASRWLAGLGCEPGGRVPGLFVTHCWAESGFGVGGYKAGVSRSSIGLLVGGAGSRQIWLKVSAFLKLVLAGWCSWIPGWLTVMNPWSLRAGADLLGVRTRAWGRGFQD